MSPTIRQALEVFVGALKDDPNLHEPGVLVLAADGLAIRRELLPQKVLLDSGYRLSEFYFGFAPRLAREKPGALALVLPVREVAADDQQLEVANPETGLYTLLVGCRTPEGTLGITLTPDDFGGFTEGEIEEDSRILSEAAPLAFAWMPHPFPPHGSLPKPSRGHSSLLRLVQRELPELLSQIEPFDEYLRGCTPAEQVLVYKWLRLRGELVRLRAEQPGVVPLLDRLQFFGQRYQGEGTGYSELALAVIAGVEEDGLPPNLGALRHGLGNTLDQAHRQGLARFQPYDLDELAREFHQIDLPDLDDTALDEFLLTSGIAFLDMLYVHECIVRQGIPLGRDERPLPSDSDECVTYLMRLLPSLSVVAPSPGLGRLLPKTSDRLFPLSGAAHARLAKDCPDVDRELGLQLAHEVFEHRHYALDHVALIDVEGFGIRRITLAPELRATAELVIGFLVEHRLGVFAGELILSNDDAGNLTIDTALPFIAGADEEEQIAPAVELMVLAVWRDLVVPKVVDEQYETEVVRKPKDKGRAERKQRKGDIEIIRYLPRRIVLRRAEEDARKERGGPTLRRLYWVGAHARRLGENEHRTYEADEFAREIGIPLLDTQTVVRPHPRGGTPEEREEAKAEPPELVRHWRSWSALDILRTRSGAKTPVG
jgi:hypothetical protein